MALSSFDLALLVDDNSFKFTCVAYVEDTLFAGTIDGNLCVYKQEQSVNGKYTLVVKKTIDPSRKPVLQLAVIPELETVITLCDGKITGFHVQKLVTKPNFVQNVKNAELVAINTKGPLYRLVVASKKRLYLYEYSQGSYALVRELIVPDNVLSMIWYGNYICLSYKREYSLLNLVNQNSCDVIDVGVPIDKSKPLLCLVNDNELLMAANENLAFFGVLVNKNPIAWTEHPIGLSRCTHYILGLLKNNSVEVFSATDPKLVQRIVFPKGFAPSIMEGSEERVIVASETQIYAVIPTSVESQVTAFLNATRVEEALALLYKINPGSDQLRDFHANAGFVLFQDLRFEDAMSHFQLSMIDPREIISFFSQFNSLSSMCPATHPRNPFLKGMTFATIFSAGKEARLKRVEDSNDKSEPISFTHETEDQLMRRVKISLGTYLWRLRSERMKDFKTPEIKIACDTVLLLIAVDLQPKLVLNHATSVASFNPISTVDSLPYTIPQFLSLENSCVIADCEPLLIESDHYNTLALLHASKRSYVKALEIWAHIGSGEYRDVDVHCNGVVESVNLLSSLPDDALIWKYAEWIVVTEPLEGLKIFTEPRRAYPISPEKVLAYLHKMHLDATSEDLEFSAPSELIQKYLEYLIFKEENLESKYHNQLGSAYIHNVLNLMKHVASFSDHGVVSERPKPGEEPAPLGNARSDLLNFLQTSSYYDPIVLLDLVENTKLYHETIILNMKLERHMNVLEIYVSKLVDYDGAAQYCIDASEDADNNMRSDLFIMLLKIYFSTQSAALAETFRNCALKLLFDFAEFIDPTAVISVLPDDISISSLSQYFERVIPITLHTCRQGKIVANLEKMSNFECHLGLIEAKSRHIAMQRESKCAWCRKHIAERTVFELFPNNAIVHLHCSVAYRDSKNSKSVS